MITSAPALSSTGVRRTLWIVDPAGGLGGRRPGARRSRRAVRPVEDPQGPSPGLVDRRERPREGDVHVARRRSSTRPATTAAFDRPRSSTASSRNAARWGGARSAASGHGGARWRRPCPAGPAPEPRSAASSTSSTSGTARRLSRVWRSRIRAESDREIAPSGIARSTRSSSKRRSWRAAAGVQEHPEVTRLCSEGGRRRSSMFHVKRHLEGGPPRRGRVIWPAG